MFLCDGKNTLLPLTPPCLSRYVNQHEYMHTCVVHGPLHSMKLNSTSVYNRWTKTRLRLRTTPCTLKVCRKLLGERRLDNSSGERTMQHRTHLARSGFHNRGRCTTAFGAVFGDEANSILVMDCKNRRWEKMESSAARNSSVAPHIPVCHRHHREDCAVR